MKLTSIALGLLSIPLAVFAQDAVEDRTASPMPASYLNRLSERTFLNWGHSSGGSKTCSNANRACCWVLGKKMRDDCSCDLGSWFQSRDTFTQPNGGGWSRCIVPSCLADCWDKGGNAGTGLFDACKCYTSKPTEPARCTDFYKKACCALKGKSVNNKCECISGKPEIPGGSTSCNNPTKVGNCWKVGKGCNARCVCEDPTPPPTVCEDRLCIAKCYLKGMATDAKCNCIPGKPTVPGGWTSCKDASKIAKCWKVGHGCNAKCVCEPPTPVPPVVGQCTDEAKIQSCARRGQGVDKNCRCIKCSCYAQWDCRRDGGTLDSGCNCVVPSGKRKRDINLPLCGPGQSICSVGGNDNAFECVNTLSNLESCGGCLNDGEGQDCTAIDGAGNVACVAGKCVVSSCAPGWTLSGNGTSCTPPLAGQKTFL